MFDVWFIIKDIYFYKYMNKFEKYFQDYFIDIRKDYVKKDFTEMTFRTALENFIEKKIITILQL